LLNENDAQFSVYKPEQLIQFQNNVFISQERQRFIHPLGGDLATGVESSIPGKEASSRHDLFTIILEGLPKHICIQLTNAMAAEAWVTLINAQDSRTNPYFLVPLIPLPTTTSAGRTARNLIMWCVYVNCQKNTVVFKFFKSPSFSKGSLTPLDTQDPVVMEVQRRERTFFQTARQFREQLFGLVPRLEYVHPLVNNRSKWAWFFYFL